MMQTLALHESFCSNHVAVVKATRLYLKQLVTFVTARYYSSGITF